MASCVDISTYSNNELVKILLDNKSDPNLKIKKDFQIKKIEILLYTFFKIKK